VGYDALVINAVESVRDRFGPAGLRALIELAQREIDRTEAAWAGLGPVSEADPDIPGAATGDETRQFQAFVAEGEPRDDTDLR